VAESCKEQQERVEETVLQPVDQWVERQEQQCRNEPCNWWTLCLNKLFCWIATVVLKIVVWVTTVVVRWVYRTVCTVVMVVVGVLSLVTGNTSILGQALQDLWATITAGFYAAIGGVIFGALRLVDIVQTAVGLQPAKRRLNDRERSILSPIYRDALLYDAIELVVGRAGLLTISGRPFTMGFTIYLPTYSEQDLVHESVHVWQGQFGGFGYIGNSALHQLDSLVFSKDYDPYEWRPGIDSGRSWYTLRSVEAQAKFIEDVYASGHFDFNDIETSDDKSPGAFFREDAELGRNVFDFGRSTYTDQANDAWRIIRTG
jgi:hypothetical protein